MNATSSNTAPNVPKNAPAMSPAVYALVMKLEKFLLRWFNFSLMSYMLARQTKLPMVSAFILATKGRKSGKWIEIPIFYSRDGENYCVIASKGGAPTHPAWFLNLEADPNCKILVNKRPMDMRARVATGEERARIWAKVTKDYPPYNDYAASAAPREIPVVVLEKR